MQNRNFKALTALVTSLFLSGCIETSQEGLQPTDRTNYARIALVAGVSDEVASTYWQAAMSEPSSIDGRMGWDARKATVSLAEKQLVSAGAQVTRISTLTSAKAGESDVVVILQQAPLSILGQNYNPGRDFLALGGGIFAIAAVSEAKSSRNQAYRPRFVLWIRNPAANKAWIGENACTVGLAASLVDPDTGKQVGEGAQVIGRSIVPGDLTARDWAGLPKTEKEKVLVHCRSALNSAVSQALRRLNVAD